MAYARSPGAVMRRQRRPTGKRGGAR